MSSRKIKRIPLEERRKEYVKLENGEAQEALWEALDALRAQGIFIGGKAQAVLNKRAAIKTKFSKGSRK